jgi:hypothetical protein
LLQHFPDHPLVITALGDIAYLRARYALAGGRLLDSRFG